MHRGIQWVDAMRDGFRLGDSRGLYHASDFESGAVDDRRCGRPRQGGPKVLRVVEDRRSGLPRQGGPWIYGIEVLRVRDFRRGKRAVNIVVGFISDVQLAGS